MNRTYIALISVLALILGTTVLGQNPQAQSDLYPFIKNDKLGFIDRSGREVIPAQFSTAADATVFREGIANVGATGGWTYIDGSGKFIVESQFWWAYPFSEGYACVLLPGEGAGYGFGALSSHLMADASLPLVPTAPCSFGTQRSAPTINLFPKSRWRFTTGWLPYRSGVSGAT